MCFLLYSPGEGGERFFRGVILALGISIPMWYLIYRIVRNFV